MSHSDVNTKSVNGQLIKDFLISVINSYGQIFFTTKNYFSIVLLIVTFFDPIAGLLGLFSVLTANLMAKLFSFSDLSINTGMYGFNALLVGLSLGVYYDLSFGLLFIAFISAVFTLFITVAIEGVLYKYGLPFLSWPFLLVVWMLNLAAFDLTSLGLSERGLYTLNELYANGGEGLVDVYQWWSTQVNNNIFTTYFISLGAIFFQYNVLAGIIIAIGILMYSRIAFSLSLLGYFSAYVFYLLIGSDISNVSYMYIGFNYILTAIAIGGFFIIASRSSYLWVLIIIPLVALLTISLSRVFAVFNISIYALPFNLIVLLFLYILKFRLKQKSAPVTVVNQEFVPEKNVYSFFHYKRSLSNWMEKIPVQLPFFGEWTVSQAHDGEYTHKNAWRHAWDFVIEQYDGKEYKNAGNFVEDYYCYGKAVLACADGYVEEVLDGIDDNVIGEVNLEDNWGNTIIIRHSPTLFSKLSHLKKHSIKVQKGEYVRAGQDLAVCGNSGRSPYPHVHFQLQATPFIGSETLSYPIASFYSEREGQKSIYQFDYPQLKDKVQKPNPETLLIKAFKMIPGKSLKWKEANSDLNVTWDVRINHLNQTYLECDKTKAKAYFIANDHLFYFTSYKGDRSSELYQFYLHTQKVFMSAYHEMTHEEIIRPNDIYKGLRLLAQDFFAPFYIWIKPHLSIQYTLKQKAFTSQEVMVESIIKNKKKVISTSSIFITSKGIEKMTLGNLNLMMID
jgi:urea transporter/murein DD-endopeptidase MepM/ murein hydrolase activator NlpD